MSLMTGMLVRRVCLFLIVCALSLAHTTAEATDSFFQGKNIRIIVASTTGGGYDTLARIVATHWPKYIPGTPDIIVQNMPGAGGIVAANYLSKLAKGDGLTVGMINRGAYLSQLVSQTRIDYDVTKFISLGSITSTRNQLLFFKSPYTSLDKLQASPRPLRYGATGQGTLEHAWSRLVQEVIPNTNFKIINYPGQSQRMLAFQKDEVEGFSVAFDTWLRSGLPQEYAKGKIGVVLQLGTPDRQRHSEFPQVPTIWEFANTGEQRTSIGVWALAQRAAYPLVLPPGVPPDTVKILRDAFSKLVSDKDFVQAASKVAILGEPLRGETLEQLYKEVVSVPPPVKAFWGRLLQN